jgi:hypothetical protein
MAEVNSTAQASESTFTPFLMHEDGQALRLSGGLAYSAALRMAMAEMGNRGPEWVGFALREEKETNHG